MPMGLVNVLPQVVEVLLSAGADKDYVMPHGHYGSGLWAAPAGNHGAGRAKPFKEVKAVTGCGFTGLASDGKIGADLPLLSHYTPLHALLCTRLSCDCRAKLRQMTTTDQ
jgi:hypothetical protein